MMFKCGLFIVTNGLTERNLIRVYDFAKKYVTSRLYISINGFYPVKMDFKSSLSTCYNVANMICPDMDVRLLLPSTRTFKNERNISVIMCDSESIEDKVLIELAGLTTVSTPNLIYKFGNENGQVETQADYLSKTELYRNVIMGGTFDRLHNGHKILLSTGALLASEKLFCGITSDNLVMSKVLADLIEPLQFRIHNCRDFLQDIKAGIQYVVEEINDPCGPTITDSDYQCIVASSETEKGCNIINGIRKDKGMPELVVDLITLVDDSETSNEFSEIICEKKMGSSKTRMRLLGKLIKPVQPRSIDYVRLSSSYVIGLTGGIASGKSSIAEKLRQLGAEIIDCDKLGHETYKRGTQCFENVVNAFGKEIINTETGEINRAILGPKVFSDKTQMKRLTDIVWPAIANLARERISKSKSRVIVVDAALLLDANWNEFCDEVWTAFVPRKEAIRRVMERNRLSESEAEKRVISQKNNQFYLEKANVVFCSLWSYEFTRSQVDRAWTELLKSRIN